MRAACTRSLGAGDVVRIEHARGLEVSVQSGLVWLTEEARNDDMWLQAGESAALLGDGLAVLEAVCNTRVRLA